jgi:transcriptional regulator with XRE-family HTH domain
MAERTATKLVIAQRLRSAREHAGLSQGQVARLLHLHRPSISELEAARRNVSAEELAELARIYDVSVSWLVGEESEGQEQRDPRIELAAREIQKLRPEDLDRLLALLSTLRHAGSEV